MTDKEKVEGYLKENRITSNENWEVGGKYCYTLCKQSYLDGLVEGRKEGYEQGKNNERELQCGKKNYEKDIAELKAQIKSFENDFDYQNKVIDKYKNDLRKLRVAYIQAQVANVISGTDFETILKNVLNGVK